MLRMPTDDLDNALVRQKDNLIFLIDSGREDVAERILDSCEGVWAACRYEYKTRELRGRIRNRRLDREAEVAGRQDLYERGLVLA